jgi:hypothetical protein
LSTAKNSCTEAKAEMSVKSNLPPSSEKSPFRIGRSQGRKFLRITVTSPVDFRLLLPKRGRISVSKSQRSGKILNLGPGGMLLESREAIPEGTFLLLRLNLNGLVILDGVLAKTKRVETTEDGQYLAGVEFCPREELDNLASKEQIEKLPVKVASFNHKLRQVISGHVRTARLATQSTKTTL